MGGKAFSIQLPASVILGLARERLAAHWELGQLGFSTAPVLMEISF